MHRLGELLRSLRQKRGLSQERLAERAQVAVRTLRYWEANQQQPRDVELKNALRALEATSQERAHLYALLTDQRSVRLTQSAEPAHNVPTTLLGPLPGIGDLLKAMRLRREWTQTQIAGEMRVNRATIIRWEATRTLPSDEDIERLCSVLQAYKEERMALQSKRLSPVSWSAQLTLDECHAQYETFTQIRSGNDSLMPFADLHALALKRQLHFLLGQSPEALRLLANVEIQHSWWLYMQGRVAEASAGNWRALNMVRGKFAPEEFWMMALNILSAHAAASAQGPENGVRLLYPWLRLLPPHLHPILLCDMAYYAGQARQQEEAAYFLQRAEQLLPTRTKKCEAEQWQVLHFRLTKARVLLSSGKPIEAMDFLSPPPPAGDGRIHELLIWAETYLAAGDKEQAARDLGEAQTLLIQMPMPKRQLKLDRLALQL